MPIILTIWPLGRLYYTNIFGTQKNLLSMWHDITHVTVSHHTKSELASTVQSRHDEFQYFFHDISYGMLWKSVWPCTKFMLKCGEKTLWNPATPWEHYYGFFSSWIILNFSIFQYEKYRKNHQKKLPKLYHLPRHIIFGFVLIIETQTFYSVSLAMVQWHEIFYGTKSDIGLQSQRTIGAWVGT